MDAISSVKAAILPQTVGASPAPAEGGFADAIRKALEAVNKAHTESDRVATEFQLGNPDVSLEDVMIALNRANVAFQAAIQVRNRLVGAYAEVMNMNV